MRHKGCASEFWYFGCWRRDDYVTMGLLPDTQNCRLRMHQECRERFPRHCRVRYPDMHHDTCVTHVPWCMPGSLSSSFLWCRWRGNVPGIPGTCATLNFTYLVRGPCKSALSQSYDAMRDEKKLIGSRSHSLAVGAATVAPWSFVDKKWAYTCVHERL